MKQLLELLFVSLFAELWLSLEASECQNLGRDGLRTSFWGNTSSGKTCFMTFHANISHSDPVRRPFEEASDWCKLHLRGSSLIVINSIESQGTVESFTGREVLQSETIITDAQKLSASFEWSWVNGHSKVPREIESRAEQIHDGACVESKHGQSLAYCFGNVSSQYRYICEYSDSTSAFSYRPNNKSYVASEGNATWYDARKECLRLGGDFASITDLQTIGNWTRLKEIQNQRYWIGLRRNKWIWNSTGDAITYTNWDGGYPDESSDKQCICINPRCRSENNRTICVFDRTWRTCNCNHYYAIVCQKEEKADVATTKMVATEGMLTSSRTTRSTTPAITTTTSTKTPIATTPATNTSSTETSIATAPTTTTTSTKTTRSTSPTTTTTSAKTPIATTPVTSTTTATITPLKPIISSVTTYTMTIAGNTAGATEGMSFSISSMKPSNHFAENQTADFVPISTGLFNSFSTKEILLVILLLVAVVFIVAAVFVIIRKRKYDRRNEGSLTRNAKQSETDSPAYVTVAPVNRPSEGIVPPVNTIYAEVEMFQRPTPSNNTNNANVKPTSNFNVIYAEPNKPTKSSTPTGKAVETADPIYLEAIEVKSGAGGGGFATQDPSAVYAEPIKLKRSS